MASLATMAGSISVYSHPEQGTTFQVLLPRTIEDNADKEIDSRPIPTGSERILLVDDDPFLVDMARTMLEGLGYKVVARTNSLEALKIFQIRPEQFDLVLTDQTMPHMTGDQLSAKLMTIRPDIPIILCTGFSELVTPEKARDMGICEFLMKPFIRRNLAETIRRTIDDKLALPSRTSSEN
jgi:CheY-like chemotaxis protein